jgi:hypothetical protein
MVDWRVSCGVIKGGVREYGGVEGWGGKAEREDI